MLQAPHRAVPSEAGERYDVRLPLLVAAAVACALLSFGFSTMWSPDRPSSTFALGCVFVPFWAFVLGGAAFVAVFIIRTIWSRPVKVSWRASAIVLIAVSLTGGIAGRKVAQAEEDEATPRVLYGRERITTVPPPSGERTKSHRIDIDSASRESSSPDGRIRIVVDGTQLIVTAGALRSDPIDLGGLDYAIYVDASPVTARDGTVAWVLVITGRATGYRAKAIVLNASGEPTYEELMERTWGLDQTALEVTRAGGDSHDIVVIAPRCGNERAFEIPSAR